MSPQELAEYLKVLKQHGVGAASVTLPDCNLNVTFVPDLPEFGGTTPEPGGWKSPNHLDNPDRLDPAALNGREYGVEQLP